MEITIQAKPAQYEKQFEIKLENITQVYRGKLDQCRCGCGGDFLYPENKVAIKNALKKFQSGKFPTTYDYNSISKEMIFEIHTHDKETRFDGDVRVGVALYIKEYV